MDDLRVERDATVDWLRAQGWTVADSDANFALFGIFPDRHAVWQGLLDRGVLVRETGPDGWLSSNWAWLAVLPVAMAITALSGLILGSPTLRLRGDYLAIVTLGFGEIVRLLADNLDEITGGSPYGATTIAGGDGSRSPSKNELAGAKFQGKHIAEIANRLFGSQARASGEIARAVPA